MKNSTKFLFLVLAASVAGVAIAEFAGLVTALPVRGETALLVFASLFIVMIAVRDYSRPLAPLKPLAPAVRPAVAPARQVRRASAIVERAA